MEDGLLAKLLEGRGGLCMDNSRVLTQSYFLGIHRSALYLPRLQRKFAQVQTLPKFQRQQPKPTSSPRRSAEVLHPSVDQQMACPKRRDQKGRKKGRVFLSATMELRKVDVNRLQGGRTGLLQ